MSNWAPVTGVRTWGAELGGRVGVRVAVMEVSIWEEWREPGRVRLWVDMEGAAAGRGEHPRVAAVTRVGHAPGWQCRAWECSQRLPVKPAGQMHT